LRAEGERHAAEAAAGEAALGAFENRPLGPWQSGLSGDNPGETGVSIRM
jgi:hypothetical protein